MSRKLTKNSLLWFLRMLVLGIEAGGDKRLAEAIESSFHKTFGESLTNTDKE